MDIQKNVANLKAKFEESKNQTATKNLLMGLTGFVVIGVSLYSAVIYIKFMENAYPDNLLQVFAYLGAIANVLLMLVLLLGKFFWFKSGMQEIFAWLVTGVEVIICILNLVLAYQLAHHVALTGPIATWRSLAPASPVFSMIGALILIMSSSELKSRHKVMDMQDKQQEKELAFMEKMHSAQMDINEGYLDYLSSAMQQAITSPAVQSKIEYDANVLIGKMLSQLSGMAYNPAVNVQRVTVTPVQNPTPALAENNKPQLESAGSKRERTTDEHQLALLQELIKDKFIPKENNQGGDTDTNFFLQTATLPSTDKLKKRGRKPKVQTTDDVQTANNVQTVEESTGEQGESQQI